MLAGGWGGSKSAEWAAATQELNVFMFLDTCPFVPTAVTLNLIIFPWGWEQIVRVMRMACAYIHCHGKEAEEPKENLCGGYLAHRRACEGAGGKQGTGLIDQRGKCGVCS